MRALVINSGAVDVSERPDPVPGDTELLVRVKAAGLNGADLLQRAGRYPPPPGAPADIPGLECAGVVVAAGTRVSRHQLGDRVMGIVSGGGQAELCLLADSVALRVPEHFGWSEAGGFPEVFTTAHDALFTQCELAPGERLLVTGAAGGVGVAAVQLGHRAGATVVASVRRQELRESVQVLGADVVIDPGDEQDHGPYDVVIELVGAGAFPLHLQSLSTGGRIVFIGVGGTGPRAELDALQLMSRRAVVRGSTLRARSLEEKAATREALERDAGRWLSDQALQVPVAAAYPLEEAQEAYERFAAGGKLGKLVLLPNPAS
ncbi:MAG: zinc-binding dehydrogenase [Acidimicrobiales bacterium]